MNEQLNLFKGKKLRDKGIKQSLDNADDKNENWSEQAYNFLLKYIKKVDEFMTEDVRTACKDIVPEPPSNRAWGGIIIKARKSGLITRKGYSMVKNPKAHATPATLWEVNKIKI